jgi:hypothetical protein
MYCVIWLELPKFYRWPLYCVDSGLIYREVITSDKKHLVIPASPAIQHFSHSSINSSFILPFQNQNAL